MASGANPLVNLLPIIAPLALLVPLGLLPFALTGLVVSFRFNFELFYLKGSVWFIFLSSNDLML